MARFYWKELRMRIEDEDEASAKNDNAAEFTLIMFKKGSWFEFRIRRKENWNAVKVSV